MKNRTAKLLSAVAFAALLAMPPATAATEILKSSSGDPLDSASSWIYGVAPSTNDIALWDGFSNPYPPSPTADLSWGGIRVLDLEPNHYGTMQIPGGPYQLALGADGIDLSGSRHDLEIYSDSLSLQSNQVWSVGRNRTLTLHSQNGPGTGALYKVGPGTLQLYYSSAASHLHDAAALGLAGGAVELAGQNYTEAVGSALVYGDATRVRRLGGSSVLELNNITRYVGGTVHFEQTGVASTSIPNDASENGGILGGWATVNDQYWAQVGTGGGNQPINDYPTFWVTDFFETNNVNLPFAPGSQTLTNAESLAINSLRFDGDRTLQLGTGGAYYLTNLTGGILMGAGAMQSAIVTANAGCRLVGPAGGDLIFHVPFLPQTLTNQVVIADNATCGLTKCGDGTLFLNQGANNTYSGLTTINAGTLRTGNTNGRRYVSSSLLINPNGTYLHGNGINNLTHAAITVSGGTLNLNQRTDSCQALLLANDGLLTGYAPFSTFTAGSSIAPVDARWGTVDVRLSAPGGIVKTTDRKLVFHRDSTITGDIRVENGTLQVASNATLTAGSLTIGTATNQARVVLGHTNGVGGNYSGFLSVTNLAVLATNPFLGPVIRPIVGGSDYTDSALILNFNHNADFDTTLLGGPGAYENNLSLAKRGSGTLTLTNGYPGTFRGTIRNEAGTLKLGNANAITNRVVDVQGGVLDVNGFSPTFELYGLGTIQSGVFGAATLHLQGEFGGVIANGAGTVAVNARGLRLNGKSTYSGGTTLNPGSYLFLDADSVPGTGPINLAGGDLYLAEARDIFADPIPNTLNLSANSTITCSRFLGAPIGFSGPLAGGSGTLKLFNYGGPLADFNAFFSSPFSFSRPMIITNGTGNSTTFISWNTNGTTQTFGGNISGNGNFYRGYLVNGGGGRTVFNGNNSYSGQTRVYDGELVVNGIASNGWFIVYSNATLSGNGDVRAAVQVLDGGILSPGNSIGTLQMTGGDLMLYPSSTTVMEVNGTNNDFITGLRYLDLAGTLVISNLGPALVAEQSFKLFSATNYSTSFGGMFSSIVPATPGPGLAWDTSNLRTNGTLKVVAAASPIVNQSQLVGTNFVLSGSGGIANGTYFVLSSTSVDLPLTNWTRIATNLFDASGDFSVTNPVFPVESQRFFLLQLP